MRLSLGIFCIEILILAVGCSKNPQIEGVYCNKALKGENKLFLEKNGTYKAIYVKGIDSLSINGKWDSLVRDSRITDVILFSWKTLDPDMDSLYRCGHCDMEVRKIGDRIIVDPDIDEHDYYRCSN